MFSYRSGISSLQVWRLTSTRLNTSGGSRRLDAMARIISFETLATMIMTIRGEIFNESNRSLDDPK